MAFIKYNKARETKLVQVYKNPEEFYGFLKVAGKGVEARVFKKIASIPAIEAEPENYLYIRNRSVSAEETYGCNQNFDGFPSEELQEKYASFIHCPVDVDHINNGDDDIIGIVIDSVYVPKQLYSINDNQLYPFSEEKRVALLRQGKKLKLIGDYVENLLAIDKKRANRRNAGLVEAIQNGEVTDTSMGCLTVGTPITVECGYKNIEDIQVGDLVKTHTGKLKPVTGLFSKPFNEGIFNIKVQGNGDDFKVTYEHPFYTIKRDKVLKWGKPDFINIELKDLNPEWIKTQDLKVGDYLAYGFNDEVVEDENATVEFARLLGYYLSDGMYGIDHRNNTTYLGFDFGINEKVYADEVLNLVRYLTDGYEPVIKQRGNCWTVIVGNTEFANKVFYYAGRYSKAKKLIPKVLYWKPEIQLELLGAFINGDGGDYNGSSYFEIANYELAQQLIQIACRNRIVWTIQKIKHIANENSVCKTGTESICWQVRFGKTANEKLAIVTDKSTYFGARPSDRKFYWKNYLWSKISKIEFDEDWIGTIYNFEVKDDESYIANNVVMHNCSVQESECSICQNIAHTEDEYCDHVRYSKGKMISYNGLPPKLCYEKNRGLDFFEDSVILSEVFAKKSGTSAQAGGEGADTGAKVLEVVAGKQVSILDSVIRKKADISTLKTDVVIIGGEPKELEQKREEYEEDREEYLEGDKNKKSMMLDNREISAKELYNLIKKSHDFEGFQESVRIKIHGLEVKSKLSTPSVIKLKSFYNKYIQARHRDEILAVSKQIMDTQEKIDKKSFKDRLKAMGYNENEIDEALAYQTKVKGNFDLSGKLKNFLVEGMKLYNEIEKTSDLQGASYGNELGTGLGDLTKRYYDSKKDDTGHMTEAEGDAGDNAKNYFWEEPVGIQHIKAVLKSVLGSLKDEIHEFIKGYGVEGVAPEAVYARFGSSDETAGAVEALKQENKLSTDDLGKLKVVGSEVNNANATTEAQESTEDVNPEGQKQQSDIVPSEKSEGKFEDFESFENYLKNPNAKYVILSGTDQNKTTDAQGNSIPAYLHPDNIQANESLKTDIRALGKTPVLIDEGYYLKQLEGKSYLVDGGSLKDGVFLGVKYNQESIVIPQGIYSIPTGIGTQNINSVNDISEEIVQKGELAPVNKTNGEPVILWGEEAEDQDGYSVINLGGQKIAFSLDIDWDKQGAFGQYLKTAGKKENCDFCGGKNCVTYNRATDTSVCQNCKKVYGKLDLVENEVKDTSDIKDGADLVKYTEDDEDLKKYEGKTMIERIQSKARRLENMLKTSGKNADQWETQKMPIEGRGIERYDSQYDKDFMNLEQGSGDPAKYKDLKKEQDKEFTTDEKGMVQKVKALQRRLAMAGKPIYIFGNDKKGGGYGTVFKVMDYEDIQDAEDKARTIAKQMGIELAGGFDSIGEEKDKRYQEQGGKIVEVPADTPPTEDEKGKLVGMIIEFEDGSLSDVDTIKLFSELIKSGMAWKLQGFYGRTAHSLIENGYLDEKGNILNTGGNPKLNKLIKRNIIDKLYFKLKKSCDSCSKDKKKDKEEDKLSEIKSHLNELADEVVEEQEKDKKNWGFEKNDDIIEDENIKGNLEEQLKKTKSALNKFGIDGIDYSVEWETDNEDVSLPKIVTVPANIPVDEVADWISDNYGWLVRNLVPVQKKTAEFGLDKTPLNVPLDTVTTHMGDDDDTDQSGMEKIMKFLDKHSNRTYEDYDRPKDENGVEINQQDGYDYGLKSDEDGVEMEEERKEKDKTSLAGLKKTLSDMTTTVPTEFTPNSPVEVKDKDSNATEQMGTIKEVKQEIGQDGQTHNAVVLQDDKVYSTDQHNIQKTSQSEEHLAEDAKNFKNIDQNATEIKKDVDELQSDDEKLKKENKKKFIDELMNMDFGDSEKLEKLAKLESLDLSDSVLDVPELVVKRAMQDSTNEEPAGITDDDADAIFDDGVTPRRNMKEVKSGNGFTVNKYGQLKERNEEMNLETMWYE